MRYTHPLFTCMTSTRTWSGRHGDYVRVTIMDYEIPSTTDDHDSNWVRVGIEARNEQGVWERNCGCMTTTDLRFFAQWFTKVVDGVVEKSLPSYEPDFQCTYLATSEGIHRFAVRLSYGLGFISSTSENNTSIIVVGLLEEERQQAISFFTQAEQRYPVRGRPAQHPPLDLPEIVWPA